MSASQTKPRSEFGEWLRERLDENKRQGRHPDSIRSLARVMANHDEKKFEAMKRSLFKWIRGMRPSEPNRVLLAAALDVEPDEVPTNDGEDDEEADLLTLALMDAVRGVVRRELAQARVVEEARS